MGAHKITVGLLLAALLSPVAGGGAEIDDAIVAFEGGNFMAARRLSKAHQDEPLGRCSECCLSLRGIARSRHRSAGNLLWRRGYGNEPGVRLCGRADGVHQEQLRADPNITQETKTRRRR